MRPLQACTTPPLGGWPRAAPRDPAIITMTSGTSGKPKCILCPFVAFATAVRALARAAGHPPP